MFKYLVIVLLLIFGTLAWMYLGLGVSAIYHEDFIETQEPHLYHDSERSIKEIEITAFYFVPQNKTSLIDNNWKELMENGLDDLASFHSLQFKNRSQISYKIYPRPVVGLNDNLFYDSESTQGGNPRALIAVSEELEQRGFTKKIEGAAYSVMFIMYEGVGAVAGVIYESEIDSISEISKRLGLPESVIFEVDVESVDAFLLINKEILAGLHDYFGTAILAHEFYHTVGVPDEYYEAVGSVSIATSDDIMGLGRLKPLEMTYLSNVVLEKLGL